MSYGNVLPYRYIPHSISALSYSSYSPIYFDHPNIQLFRQDKEGHPLIRDK